MHSWRGACGTTIWALARARRPAPHHREVPIMTHPGHEAAELVSLSNAGRSLRGLAELAAAEVPGCIGAAAVVWHGPDDATTAATHPDLAQLIDMQMRDGDGPLTEAIRLRAPVRSPDLLGETRWPAFSTAALAAGTRCCACVVGELSGAVLVLALFGSRPGALDEERTAGALAALGGAVLTNASVYGAAQMIAAQF